MKTKEEFTIRIDSELYKKLIFVASKENNNLNNHMLHMIRQNVQYFEKVHGRINTQNIELPEKQDTWWCGIKNSRPKKAVVFIYIER